MSYGFIDNKYKKWYLNIIEDRKNRILDTNEYYEKHHIIPKSIGGEDKQFNIISLTAREHFICHLLLIRMVQEKDVYKMVHAMTRFSKKINNSIEYELLRKSISKYSKGKYNKSYNKIWVHRKDNNNIEYIKKEDFDRDLYIKGLPYQRGGHKNYIWINNGIKSSMIPAIKTITDGWKRGRLDEHIRKEDHLKYMSSKRHTKDKDGEHSEKMKNRICIVKNGVRKRIKKEDFQYWVEYGWKIKKIIIHDNVYLSIKNASIDLDIHQSTIKQRLISDSYKWNDWKFRYDDFL